MSSSSGIIPQRPLGSQGLVVSAQGLGCMTMTGFYGGFDRSSVDAEAEKTLRAALDAGINFLDTAWIYQSFGSDGGPNVTNEEVIGAAVNRIGRDRFVIATKCGFCFQDGKIAVSNNEELIRAQLEESLARLGVGYVDLYYVHRIDASVPIEDTMRVLKSLVEAGKVKYVGLSECTPSELRRAHAVFPVTAIQMEWSLQTREIEAEIVPTARELGVGIVPYSPLGRGFLADLSAFDSLAPTDSRAKIERFQGDNLAENKRRIQGYFDVAQRIGCTPAQLALAWLHSQGDDVVPIPGTKREDRVIENARAFLLAPLSAPDRDAVEAAVSLVGERAPPMSKAHNFNNRI